MPELLTPAFLCSSFAFPNIPLKFSPHYPIQETVIGNLFKVSFYSGEAGYKQPSSTCQNR